MRHFYAASIAPFMVTISMTMSIMSITVSAERHRVSVSEDNIDFNLDYFDDGRTRPYRVVFEGNARNVFDFEASGAVKIMRIGTERYRVVYAAGGRIRRVIQTSSGRRELLEDEGEYDVDMQVLDAGTMARPRRRLLYSCDDCEETWDTVCEEGIPSVCNVVGYGSPFSTEANAAIEVMCSTLGNACAGSTGDEVCDGQCVGDDVNACFDPTSSQYKCEFTGDDAMRLGGCGLTDDDLTYLPACFEAFGKTNLNTLDLGNLGLTSLPEGLFSGLVNLNLFYLYYNNLTELPAGIFSELESLVFIYLRNNQLATLPDRVFEGCPNLRIVSLYDNELVGFRAEAFAGMEGVTLNLDMRNNNLTTLPDGLFSDMRTLDTLVVDGNPNLQCIPETQGRPFQEFSADEELGDIVNDGMCECNPEEAVMCEPGTSCEPGAKGYTCGGYFFCLAMETYQPDARHGHPREYIANEPTSWRAAHEPPCVPASLDVGLYVFE